MSNSTINTAIRKYLLAGVAKQSGVDEAQAALDAARGGMYACTVQAAIAAKGDKAAFVGTVDKLMDDFRGNVRGIAVRHNMEQAKDKTGKLAVDSDGNPRFKVPGSLSTAKSVLGGAFDHKIELGTIAKPNSFGSVRDAATLAKAEAKAEADKVAKETADKLNEADGMIFQTEKQLTEFGDKLSADKKKPIEDALAELKKAHEAKDLEAIEKALETINEAWKNASEEMYKAQAEAGSAAGGPGAEAEPGDPANASGDDVQDVDFEEVK